MEVYSVIFRARFIDLSMIGICFKKSCNSCFFSFLHFFDTWSREFFCLYGRSLCSEHTWDPLCFVLFDFIWFVWMILFAVRSHFWSSVTCQSENCSILRENHFFILGELFRLLIVFFDECDHRCMSWSRIFYPWSCFFSFLHFFGTWSRNDFMFVWEVFM